MKAFLQRFGAFVLGVLCGFDRLRFRGSKRLLCHPGGLFSFLCQAKVLVKDYKAYAKDTTIALCKAIEKDAKGQGIYRYLNNNQVSKEATALEIAAEHGRTEGLIAVLGCVEPCRIMQVRGDRESKRLKPALELGKCLHYYHYYRDPQFGLRYTRLQSWFPFTLHAGLNGRDWLAQQLTTAGVAYVKKDNCFPWVADWEKAQHLLDEQLTTQWPALLDGWAEQSHPWLANLLPTPVPYYWSLQEGEFATDIAFGQPEELARLYPRLVQWATTVLQNAEVLRFFGQRKVTQSGKPYGNWEGEILTTIKQLVEGTCVKHRLHENLLKMYDKFGLLRLENLLIRVRDFKVYRQKEGDSEGPMSYLPLRKGVADIHRRAEIGKQINDRYAAALATVEDATPLGELTHDLVKPTTWKGRRVRALNPLAAEDLALLEAINHGEFLLNGFRNRDLRALLAPTAAAAAPEEARRQSSKITRRLRMLRAHGLIKKVPHSHRYQVTNRGRQTVTALLAARNAGSKKLLQAA